jgi:predicted membrane channel-forming protein YqfA (hemolysin III family)
MTILYILCLFLFVKFSRHSKKDLLFSIVWSAATLACSLTILIQSLNDSLMLTFIIPFAMIFITPLYAIIALFNRPGFLLESIALTAISLTWVVTSSILFKRAK